VLVLGGKSYVFPPDVLQKGWSSEKGVPERYGGDRFEPRRPGEAFLLYI
jgi:hypothetical protein